MDDSMIYTFMIVTQLQAGRATSTFSSYRYLLAYWLA